MRIYLDASVVILRFEGRAEVRERLYERFRDALEGGDELFASELTRLECRVGPLRHGNEDMLERYDEFFSGRDVTIASFSRDAWDFAADVRAKHRLSTPDALHVACAVTSGCDLLLTADARLARCPAIKTELVSP